MPTDDTNFEDELRALLAAGRKIEAIKQYRVTEYGRGKEYAEDQKDMEDFRGVQ